VAFTLKPGQVSQIVRTPYGYHLIKCTGVKPPPTFEEAKQDLRQLYQRMYFKQDQQKYLAGLESEVHFTQHDSVTSLLWAAVDSAESHKDSSWTARISPSLGAATVMSIGGRTVSVDSLVSLLKSNPAMQTAKPTRLALADEAQKISENIVFAAKADLLVHTDPMFASLMNQYADGLLLYQIEQDRVWNSVAGNDSLLHIFFESHRDSYTFPDRVKFSQIHLLTAEDAAAAHRLLKGGMTMESIVTYDSLRLRSPDMSSVTFGRHGTALTRDAMKTLDGIGKQMNVDGAMSIELIAHVDTIRRVADSTLQASRQAAIADYLTRTQGVGAGRIHRVEQPLPAAHDARTRKARAESGLRIDIRAMGRRPVVNGRVAAFVLADSADARARVADSLAAGDCSAPLKYGDGYVIVRLDGREPARRKTYEEAAGEVSSAYQELESKRLTDEWMKELRSAFPVVEHREVLDQALAQHP